jgi:CspA family cold shock protein
LRHINNLILLLSIMKTGLVKFFNETKGFGFIKMDDTGEEIFVHVSGLSEKIKQDDKVSFDVTEGKKGPNAINVKKI